jgi:hypothetical protein
MRLLSLFGKVRKLMSSREERVALRGQNVGHSKSQGVGHHKTTSEVAGSLAGLEVDQKSATHTRRHCKLILTHIQGLPSASDD